MSFVEALESRQFLSVTPGQVKAELNVIKLDEKTLKNDLKAANSEAKADVTRVFLDFKRLGIANADKVDLNTLKSDGHNTLSNLDSVAHSSAGLINQDVARLIRDEKHEIRKPNSVNETLVSNDITKLRTDSANVLTAMSTSSNTVNTALDGDSNTLAALPGVDTSTTTDLSTATTHLSSNLGSANGAAAAAFQTDPNALIALFES